MRLTWPLGLIIMVGLLLQSISPLEAAPSCTPAVNASVQTLQRDRGEVSAVRVALTPTAGVPGNQLLRIAFTSISNGAVRVGGAPIAVPSAMTPSPNTTSWSFDLYRVTSGQSFQVTYVVTDQCGDSSKFAGAGTGTSVSPTQTPAELVATTPTATLSPTMTTVPTATPPAQAAQQLAGPYTASEYETILPWGSHSHWIQPWRGYQETVPASTFVDGLGMNLNLNGQDPDLVMRMLSSHGIKRVRIEIGWGKLSYDETGFNAPEITAQLTAAKKYGVRPLILLNANEGLPCPTDVVSRTVPDGAPAGATTLRVNDATDLRAGYSGLSNMSRYWAAESLITQINGATLTLSKPLPVSIPAGAAVSIATLRYRPFSVPGSADYQATMAGWLKYVDLASTGVRTVLGTQSAQDKGFDLEIWNELTFGSAFLDINNYYSNHPYQYDEVAVIHDLVVATANYIGSNSAYSGVKITDGFASTMPWQGASLTPNRVGALSKHPYPPRLSFPTQEASGQAINAAGQATSYVPTYAARFPEYFGTGIQTESMVRDMGPISSTIAGVVHGRYGRTSGGQILPVDTWVTEVNLAPNWLDPSISAADAVALKAKTSARFAAFFLNKGVRQLFFYGATGGDTDVGMVLDSFLAYAKQPGATYPASDVSQTSPALATLGRMASQFSAQLDRSLTSTRSVQVASISDTHNHAQFTGNGSTALPPLYDREVLAILPFQVNASRFVIPYYVMTRDVSQSLAPEQFTVRLTGLRGTGATVTAYDPIRDVSVPVTVVASATDSLTVLVTAADYPYLLTVQES
jgi:hypothetical protein